MYNIHKCCRKWTGNQIFPFSVKDERKKLFILQNSPLSFFLYRNPPKNGPDIISFPEQLFNQQAAFYKRLSICHLFLISISTGCVDWWVPHGWTSSKGAQFTGISFLFVFNLLLIAKDRMLCITSRFCIFHDRSTDWIVAREAGRLGKGWASGEPTLGVMQCTRSVLGIMYLQCTRPYLVLCICIVLCMYLILCIYVPL